jgi:hypothetical protein
MEQIQLIQITPEQLQEAIIDGVKIQLDDLKNHFQPKIPTEYLTRVEVKELLKVDLSTIHNWSKRGKIQAYGLGGRVYYKRSEIDSVIIPLK